MFSASTFKKCDNIKIYLVFLIALFGALFHLYTGGFGYDSVRDLRITHWLVMSTLVFLLYPTSTSNPNSKISKTVDAIFFIMAFLCGIYILFGWQTIVIDRGEVLTSRDVFFGVLAIIVVLEAVRRVTGWVLFSVTLLSVIYFFIGYLMPGKLGHRAFSVSYVASLLYVSTDGIYGLPIGISAQYIALFIMFSAILNAVKGDMLFNDLANALVGHLGGGTAKVAVVSSALFGMVSGSAAANVATTGSFTIPAMKKTGFPNRMAGAIEAVASTAGQITPPVMGIAAFLIADLIGIKYITICFAAIIPAFLYYLIVYIAIHIYSKKLGLSGMMTKEERPKVLTILKERGHLLLAIILFLYLMIAGYSPMFSIFWGLVCLFFISFFKVSTRVKSIKELAIALTEGIKRTIPIAAACAAAGIISCALLATGVGLSFSNILLNYTAHSLVLTLVLTMLATLLLGCGMPTTPAYIIVSVITVQSLIGFGGISDLQAHFFIFFFACLSSITLPVALSCYVASGIAKETAMKIGSTAMVLAAGVWFIPFFFIYKKGVLLVGSVHEIFLDIITSTTLIICLAFFTGHLLLRWKQENKMLLFTSRKINFILLFCIAIIVLVLPLLIPYTSVLSTIINSIMLIGSIWLGLLSFKGKDLIRNDELKV